MTAAPAAPADPANVPAANRPDEQNAAARPAPAPEGQADERLGARARLSDAADLPDDPTARGPGDGPAVQGADPSVERAAYWVFAYGSLMWDPQIPVCETVIARVAGYARSFCLRSICHRGTPERPGLVLGLLGQPGGECRGLALGIAAADWPEVLAELRRRELVTEAYAEAWLPLTLEDGRAVEALAYVMRDDHWQTAPGLSLDEQAGIIATANGGRGPNAEYLFNTVAHLEVLGLVEPPLVTLAGLVRAQIGKGEAG